MSLDQLYRGIAEIPGIENFTASFLVTGSELTNSGSIYQNLRALETSSGYVTQKFGFPTASFGTASLGTASFSIQSNTISEFSASLVSQSFYTSSQSSLTTATNFRDIRFRAAEYYGNEGDCMKFHSPVEFLKPITASIISSSGDLALGAVTASSIFMDPVEIKSADGLVMGGSDTFTTSGPVNKFNVDGAGNVLIGGNVTASAAISSSGDIIGNKLTISSNEINFANLPTSDPGVAGRLYRDGATVKVSL